MPTTTTAPDTYTAPVCYTYDAQNFSENDYTEQELYILIRDILQGICKPEVPTVHYISEAEFYGQTRYKRRQRTQRLFKALAKRRQR